MFTDFGAFLAQNPQFIGIFRVSSIMIEARQVLNFLSSREFLGFWHFEPQFSYKQVLIEKKSVILLFWQYVSHLKSKWVYSIINWILRQGQVLLYLYHTFFQFSLELNDSRGLKKLSEENLEVRNSNFSSFSYLYPQLLLYLSQYNIICIDLCIIICI